jgi:hypothetical protein
MMILQEFNNFLKKLSDETLQLSCTKYVTCSLVILNYNSLFDQSKLLANTTPDFLMQRVLDFPP